MKHQLRVKILIVVEEKKNFRIKYVSTMERDMIVVIEVKVIKYTRPIIYYPGG